MLCSAAYPAYLLSGGSHKIWRHFKHKFPNCTTLTSLLTAFGSVGGGGIFSAPSPAVATECDKRSRFNEALWAIPNCLTPLSTSLLWGRFWRWVMTPASTEEEVMPGECPPPGFAVSSIGLPMVIINQFASAMCLNLTRYILILWPCVNLSLVNNKVYHVISQNKEI